MTHCERVQTHLNDFLDGTLAAPRAQELNLHLQDCPACRREYNALKATQALVRHVAVPEGTLAKRRVMARFRQDIALADITHRERSAMSPATYTARWRTRLLPLGTMAAAAILLCLFMISPLHSRQEPAALTGTPVFLATAACSPTLPTADDLDQMTSAHAVQSFTVQNGSEELQQEALADANSRLSTTH
jgi:anti-sigma factor RsiW